MKYIPADKLVAEIERRKDINAKIVCEANKKYCIGYADAIKDILHTITSIQQEQPGGGCSEKPNNLSSNLDEAAKEYRQGEVDSGYDYIDDSDGDALYHSACLADAFKAGAEWMAGQGVSVDGEVVISHGNKTIEHRGRYGIQETTTPGIDVFNVGDKVVVQIRKK